ncbi:MAG: hypothetical protein ACRD2B_15320 [Terriglobia bacterium]
MPNSNLTQAETKKARRLLTEALIIRNPCDLDLLMFLYRHPRIFLTSEQIGAFVGHPMNQVAASLEIFTEAGLLDRTQNATHAARMYHLKFGGPEGDGLKKLLTAASTSKGRRGLVEILRSPGPSLDAGVPQGKLRLLRMA